MSLIKVGGQFPPADHIERIAKYRKMKAYFDGKHQEVYDRATQILTNPKQIEQLDLLYIAINLPYILCLKPADLLIGDRPTYDSGKPDDSAEQKALNSYVEENDLNTLIYESATANGYRGDSFLKVRYGKRNDYSELNNYGLREPVGLKSEPIIEHVKADLVYPEVSDGNVKKFKAINICQLEWVDVGKREIPYLNVEKHIPGYIIYERFRLGEIPETGVNSEYGLPITYYKIEEKIGESKIEATRVPHMLVFHVPYSSVDEDWQGQGFIEKVVHALQTLEDRLQQLDYILLKHSDPTLYGPEIEGMNQTVQFGGKYIPLRREDATPGAITWDGQLDSVFKEIEFLVSYIFQMSETPQWLFGTTMTAGGNAGGTGTSHTDATSIKARFMPILSKVKRIRNNYDKTIRDILWTCYLLDKKHGSYTGADEYPKIHWKDGIPKNELEEAQIMALRTGDKPTLDQKSAIKRIDEVDDMKADEIINRIGEDVKRVQPVGPEVFNLGE